MTEEEQQPNNEIAAKSDLASLAPEEQEECKKKAEEYLNNWKRERADFVNYKTDENQRLNRRGEVAKMKVIEDFLEIKFLSFTHSGAISYLLCAKKLLALIVGNQTMIGFSDNWLAANIASEFNPPTELLRTILPNKFKFSCDPASSIKGVVGKKWFFNTIPAILPRSESINDFTVYFLGMISGPI